MTDDGTDAWLQQMNVDTSVPHSARVWNYWLGGKDNYETDRRLGEQIKEAFPGILQTARADRGFLNRAVRYLAGEAQVRQFLDIGTGLPTVDNTHEVAQQVAPECRIVYVDNDPIVLVHARALLTSTPEGATDYVAADVHEPDTILSAAARTLDFTQPVAITMLGLVHFILDNDEASAVINRLMGAVPAGSYLAISHASPVVDPEGLAENMRQWNANGTPKMRTRTAEEIARLFEGLEVLEPGLVSLSRWRPEPSSFTTPEVDGLGAVARKR
jgi:S-adenosyl methyltransferase